MVLVGLSPALAGYDAAQTDAFYQRLKERARALPGVTSVGHDVDHAAEPGQPRERGDRPRGL